MKITEALFSGSSTRISEKPKQKFPEFAFIGRSNVGKSSLINMLCKNKKLAMTSSKPGKTRLVNHFLINRQWYLVDLPGYGYAKMSATGKPECSEGGCSSCGSNHCSNPPHMEETTSIQEMDEQLSPRGGILTI